MSLLNPVNVPVKSYEWDDAGALLLNKTAKSLINIIKSCLVSGYGTKVGAGWSIAFEDTAAGVVVLRSQIGAYADFYLHLSADSGVELTAKIYSDMTDINTGTLVMQCPTSFKYGAGTGLNGKWTLIASSRGFWFFNELPNNNGIVPQKSGSYFFAGSVGSNTKGEEALYMRHTGGSWGVTDDDRASFFNTQGVGSASTAGVFYNTVSKEVSILTNKEVSVFDSESKNGSFMIAAQIFLKVSEELWLLPAYSVSNPLANNYEKIVMQSRTFVNHSTGTRLENGILVATDYWEL